MPTDRTRVASRPMRACCAVFLAASACRPAEVGAALPPGIPMLRPAPRAETEPVAHEGDAADDPAIWVHPTDRAQSLILATNKQDGLEVYDLSGTWLATYADGARPGNVDVAYAIEVGSERIDVAAAGVGGSEVGLLLWSIDPATRALQRMTPHAMAVLEGSTPYGSTVYRRARDGALFLFVNDREGRVEQYSVRWDAGAEPVAALVRAFDVGTQVEGCVADEELGRFYVSEENRAIWRYGAEPDDPTGTADRVAVDTVGAASGAVADIEGLSIYYGENGGGYLIASIQGAHRFHVYERGGANRFVAVIDPAATPSLGDIEDTDGIAVESFALAPPFDRGLFVAQDGQNGAHNQNFKLYAWPDVAADVLAIEPARDPRARAWRRD